MLPDGIPVIVVDPVVPFAATVTVPVYVAVGVEHATLIGKLSALALVAPVNVLVIVIVPGSAVSVLVIFAVAEAAIGVAGCSYTTVESAPQV